jgi:Nucleotide modification associated domain 2
VASVPTTPNRQKMTKIYSYILRFDDGAAPNPFWDICTLTICKPTIRRNAKIGDWVIGTGSKNSKCNDGNVHDLSDSLVFAMKISDIKTLEEYDIFCNRHLPKKIPNWRSPDWRLRMGDCIYDYTNVTEPKIRGLIHNEENRRRDLGGINSLLSNNFYYFGEEARPIPTELKQIIKRNQGHKKIELSELVTKFEVWIDQFETNKIYADSQMRSIFDTKVSKVVISKCAKQHFDEDEDETEETIC